MNHTAEIIAVGTELLLGNIANTNAQFLSSELSTLGINVFHHTVVGDNPERLMEAVEIAKKRGDIIITTGGLGPTYDDLTKETLAKCFGKKLEFHQASADKIKGFFEKLGRAPTENNFRQAMLPEGCTVLENFHGTAPGCAFEAEGCLVIMLPGPPRECKLMFSTSVVPLLQERSDSIIVSHTLRIYGIGESAMEELLAEQMTKLQNPTLAPYAKTGEVELRITAKASTEEEANALIAPVKEEVLGILGDKVYGIDVDSLEQVCLKLLAEKGLTVGTAESCTGGYIAKRLTDIAGASRSYVGTLVTYTPEMKTKLLGVKPETIAEFGVVSAQVAEEMAKGASTALGCDIALATTGVAGPGPDADGKPAGLVYVAIHTPKGTISKKIQTMTHSRETVRVGASQFALDALRRYLCDLLHFSS